MNATCRIEKQTKRPAIFFYDPDNGLSVYSREEMHGTACIEYYRENTRLARNFSESSACVQLMQHYADYLKQFDVEIVYVKRLKHVNC